MKTRTSGSKIAMLTSAALATAFVVFGGLAHGFTLNSVVWLALSGAVFGAIAAPEIEPKAFRYPVLWQVCFSSLGGVFVAAHLDAPPMGYVLAATVGVVAGYLAPYWIKHLQVP
ncbi:MAG: hypothetical protein U1C04_22245 [Hydrogenophaga sp.]|jgi:hypothetical protein|uniref:hypothetical protein n=1 Tax=Hydrogenophaga sp. TaxID=1904254 RepID=UPI002ABA826D|nr:hypothetical protein [Hydrogenophaga sp.]MDZ4283469.1 hypothetical protein [Hydrogenophaga sp.]